MNESRWGKAVDNLFNGGGQVSFASVCEASKIEDEWKAKIKQKFGTDKITIETAPSPNNSPIDLTTPVKPISLERVRQLKKELSKGFSYSARTNFGRRFEVDVTPKREDSKLLAYGSITKLEYDLVE